MQFEITPISMSKVQNYNARAQIALNVKVVSTYLVRGQYITRPATFGYFPASFVTLTWPTPAPEFSIKLHSEVFSRLGIFYSNSYLKLGGQH